jgi:hypothetical protein
MQYHLYVCTVLFVPLIHYHSGGTVLGALIASQAASLKNASISVLVRGDEQARVSQEKWLRTIDFKGFDNDSTIKKAASEHDGLLPEIPHLVYLLTYPRRKLSSTPRQDLKLASPHP